MHSYDVFKLILWVHGAIFTCNLKPEKAYFLGGGQTALKKNSFNKKSALPNTVLVFVAHSTITY